MLDKDDKCPLNKGPKENDGCPYIDTDGDGILDKDDACVNIPGVITNFGCPEIEEEEKEILQTAFENLEFETAKAVIKETSFESLDKLAELLVKKPDWKLKITGHTDSQGGEQNNLILSKKRSEAVAAYLISKGIDIESRLIIAYFGEEKPIADNSTPEGRQANRRVEMDIIFE
jgi:outer membrane protein OmpA-like peptidoglycan-associated protein